MFTNILSSHTAKHPKPPHPILCEVRVPLQTILFHTKTRFYKTAIKPAMISSNITKSLGLFKALTSPEVGSGIVVEFGSAVPLTVELFAASVQV